MDSNASPPSFPPPPPFMAPPPIIVPPASPPPPKRGRGWMVFALILLVLLVVSMLANFGQLISGFAPARTTRHVRVAGPRLDEVLVEDNDAASKILVVDVDGIITS